MTVPTFPGGRCQCPACGESFSSSHEFDRHRTGDYAEPGKWQGSRRCMTVAELHARGWDRNAGGFLMQPRLQRAPVGVQVPRVTLPATHVPGAPDEAP